MTFSRKELLRAAKSNISSQLEAQIEKCDEEHAELCELMETAEGDRYDELWEASHVVQDRRHALEKELEALGKKKSLKKQIKSSLEWSVDSKELRKAARERQTKTVRDPEALRRVRDTEAKKKRLKPGEWLYEGALVKHRSSANPLIVISHSGNTVEVLDGAIKRHFRAVALRPMDFDE